MRNGMVNDSQLASAMSVYKKILPSKMLEDGEIQEIIEEEEMQPPLKKQKTSMMSLNDSFFNVEFIEQKGNYKQFYQDLLDQIDVTTNWKDNIQKNSLNRMLDNDSFQKNVI